LTRAWLSAAACAAALLLAATMLLAQLAVPPSKARVTDLTGTLTAHQRAALEQKLQAFETKKGSQIFVLIVDSTEPEDVAEFGIRVADQWKPGRKGIDDGAILIVAKKDRRLRLEVGYGLEGALTDATSRRIIDEVIAPRFRQGDFFGGLEAGVDRMIRVAEGEPLPPPEPQWQRDSGLGRFGLFAFVGVLVIAPIMRAMLGRLGGALALGGLAGVVTWFLTFLVGSALLAGLIGFAGALVFGGGSRRWSGGRRSMWTGGGPRGWGGGRGGGLGGFGGGRGGGFGGGGASGGW
jgi:uncharacterized protein